MTSEQVIARLREALTGVGDDLAVVYLFGSHARDQATPSSDVDVAILLGTPPPSTLDGLHLDLAARLEGALGLAVDLVVLNHAPVDLVHRVLRDGQIVVERDRSARIRFEVKSRAAYFDLEPYLRLYRRQPPRVA